MKKVINNIFASLKIRNFKLYFYAQLISLSGTWMQGIALSWLAYEITGTGTALGIALSLQYVPLLLFGIFGGYFADKLPKYETLFVTQFLYSLIPFLIAGLIFSGSISIWWLYFASLWQGLMRIVDNPVRQAFISQIVDKENIKNAVSLYSTSSNVARIIGPIFAGIILAKYGAGWCFLINAFSFLFVIFMLSLMRKKEFEFNFNKQDSADLSLKDSLKYIWNNALIRDTLFLASLFGMFVLTFQTTFPIFTKEIFGLGVTDYSLMVSLYGTGSVVGGLYAAQDKILNQNKVRFLAIILAFVYLSLAFPINYYVFILIIFFVGFFTVQVLTTSNALIRSYTDQRYIGMSTALWSMATIGMGAIGSLYIGLVSDLFGPRVSVLTSGLILLILVFIYYKDKSVVKLNKEYEKNINQIIR